MIGFLRGTLLKKQPPLLILDVNGVGYEIDAPMTTFYILPDIGNEIEIFTHLVVRDDAHLLFGFATEDERHLFRNLIKIPDKLEKKIKISQVFYLLIIFI